MNEIGELPIQVGETGRAILTTREQQQRRMDTLGREKGVESLAVNVSEDSRFIAFFEDERTRLLPQLFAYNRKAQQQGYSASGEDFLTQDAQQLALTRFEEAHPDVGGIYEANSIWFNEENNVDIRNDLYYQRISRQAEEARKQQLLEIKAKYTTPQQQMDVMATEYDRIHFETRGNIYQAYKEKFSEKAAIYRAAGEHNAHIVDFDEYARKRLESLALKTPEQRAFGIEFCKYLIKSDLGADAPMVPLLSEDQLLEMVQKIDLKDKENIIIEILKLLAKAVGGVVAKVIEKKIPSDDIDETDTALPIQKAA